MKLQRKMTTKYALFFFAPKNIGLKELQFFFKKVPNKKQRLVSGLRK